MCSWPAQAKNDTNWPSAAPFWFGKGDVGPVGDDPATPVGLAAQAELWATASPGEHGATM